MAASGSAPPSPRRVVGVVGVLIVMAVSAFAGEIPRAERRSGYELMSPETRAMQDDDTANPGMLWVLEGEALWNRKIGAAGRACADCHGDARATMKGVAARHPAFDAARGRPITLEQRIGACRVDRQQAPPLAHESRERPFGNDVFPGLQHLSRETAEEESQGFLLSVGVRERDDDHKRASRETSELDCSTPA